MRVLVAISYLYSNPAKDNLTYNVDDYEEVSSWALRLLPYRPKRGPPKRADCVCPKLLRCSDTKARADRGTNEARGAV